MCSLQLWYRLSLRPDYSDWEEVGDICKKIDIPDVNKKKVTRDAIRNVFHNHHYCDMKIEKYVLSIHFFLKGRSTLKPNQLLQQG